MNEGMFELPALANARIRLDALRPRALRGRAARVHPATALVCGARCRAARDGRLAHALADTACACRIAAACLTALAMETRQ